MSIIGEAILTTSIEILFRKLASSELLQFASQAQIRADLKKWENILLKIYAVLDDAEEKQMTNRFVKLWLDDLKNLAYDVEDILDEFATEALRMKLLIESDHASRSKLRNLIPTCCISFNAQSFMFNNKMKSKIKEITVRLQEVSTQKSSLNLKDSSGGRPNQDRDRRTPSTSLNETHVYGREEDREAIVERLMREEGTNDGFSVIPITGMGGVGKTTLAQIIYNDVRVQANFDIKGWVCVSTDFDVVRLTRTILQFIASVSFDMNDLNKLQVELKEQLFGKKFLLVLDDVWNEDYEKWTIMCRPLEGCSRGSKIVVTTRSQRVSTMMVGTLSDYPLKELSNEDCLCLFTQHSLGTRDFSMHQDLKTVGEKIVDKCNGLPLAAKALGGLLRGKTQCRDWEKVLNSKIWDLPEEGNGILPALRLSYHYLPPHLKRCFAYCSIFPKDLLFPKKTAIVLWMAEGFLEHEASEKEMEDLGDEYFCDLVSRSFFQQSTDDLSMFLMHDLINDLAEWATKEICFKIEHRVEGDKNQNISKNLRHLSHIGGGYDGVEKFEAFHHVKHLRTFWTVASSEPGNCHLTSEVLHILPKLRRLRVLSLFGYCIFELPNAIGDLKLLRHLDLSYSKIEALPESVSNLCNLQTLTLDQCKRLKKICADMGGLVNMRHLFNDGVDSLKEMPRRIGKLSSLRSLLNFVVGEGTGSRLGELKSLVHLEGKLRISRLENVNDAGDAREADLNGKRGLNILMLEWTSHIDDSRNAESETRVLDMLRPNVELLALSIKYYGGTQFPSWLGDSSFMNLLALSFEGCYKCNFLPSLGHLPLLKNLVIRGMVGVKSLGSEFYGTGNTEPFPSLETLCFEDMDEWIDWIPHESSQEVKGFFHLQELSIVRCPKLLGTLPQLLPSLEKLIIKRCEQLSVCIQSFPTLSRLEIDGCKEMVGGSTVDLRSLNSVVLSDISSLVFRAEQFLRGLTTVRDVRIAGCREQTSLWQNGIELLQDIHSLHRLEIVQCPQLLSLVIEEGEEEQQGLPCGLEYLFLSNCESLVKLPRALHNLSSLRQICIIGCPKLVSFPDIDPPSQLRSIYILECDALESLPEAWMRNNNASLFIGRCDSLTCIAKMQLPLNLKWMEIQNCKNLQTLVDEDVISTMHEETTSYLEWLDITNCPSLTSFFSKSELPPTLRGIRLTRCSNLSSLSSRGKLPESLKYLTIDACSNLEVSLNDLHELSHIREIAISGCPNLVCLPEGELLSKYLTKISIDDCEKLEALLNCMHILTSLQQLTIKRCPGIVSFPEGGLPTNLTSLEIEDLKICKPLFEWGLHKLTSLRKLSINGGCPDVVFFPQDDIGMMLPASLTTLSIKNFPNLKYLSPIVQNLTSLEELELFFCPKLKYFPKKGLPRSLLRLYIRECPLLIQRCVKDKGKYWPMIAHIPSVSINLRFVFDPAMPEVSFHSIFGPAMREININPCTSTSN